MNIKNLNRGWATRSVRPAAVAGLVLATGIKMAASLGRTPRALGFLIVTVVAIALLRWPLVPILLVLIPLSVLVAWIRRA